MNIKCILYGFWLMIFLCLFQTEVYSQLTVDAGNDTTLCSNPYTKSLEIGTNVQIKNGVEPYTIAWECEVIPYGILNKRTASDILNDSTLISPSIIDGAWVYTSELKFKLSVTDSIGNYARDSITIGFSGCGCVTGYLVFEINKGDSVWLDAGIPSGRYARYYFEPAYGLSTPDSSATWAKPDEKTDYSIVTVDTFGCECSCHAYEVRVTQTDTTVLPIEWAPIGAEWYFSRVEGLMPPNEGYTIYNVIGDTIINDKIVKKINKTYYHSNGENISDQGYEYTYEEDGIVYYLRNGNFYTLYNFNAQAGDTWTVYGKDNIGDLCGYDSLGVIVVDSISSEIINDHELKVLYTSCDSISNWFFSGKIIKGIGCTGFMFPQAVCCILDFPPENGPLRCYEDNLIGHYESNLWKSSNYNCNKSFNYNSLSDVKINPFFLYPNPVINVLNICSSENLKGNLKIEVLDIMGKTLIDKKYSNSVFVGTLSPGLYLAKISISNRNYILKFIKE